MGAGKTAREAKALIAKSDEPSLMPGTHVKLKKNLDCYKHWLCGEGTWKKLGQGRDGNDVDVLIFKFLKKKKKKA